MCTEAVPRDEWEQHHQACALGHFAVAVRSSSSEQNSVITASFRALPPSPHIFIHTLSFLPSYTIPLSECNLRCFSTFFLYSLLFSSALQFLLPVIHAVSKASWVSPPSWETVPEFDTQLLSAAAAPSSSVVCARCLVLCSILLTSGIDIEDPETIWHELIDRCPAL